MNARPQNCGTGYCSCIECIYGKDGCVADEEQCNDGCLARESVIANALKLADEIVTNAVVVMFIVYLIYRN